MTLAPIFPLVQNITGLPPALHIPDGFLSLTVALIFWLVAIIFIAVAVRQTDNRLGDYQIPLMGVMAAFVFAGQMINFPVAGGTSGHFLGGTLVAIVLGPWAGILVMTSVIGLQALLFQDGGLLAMGANLFNMRFLTITIGYGLYRAWPAKQGKPGAAGVALAAWLSVMAAALATSLELWFSGTVALAVVLPAMLGVHALIGLGEAAITVAALRFIQKSQPDLLTEANAQAGNGRGWIVAGLALSGAIVLFSPWASASPDGLEGIAADIGFMNNALAAPLNVFSNYTVPWLGQAQVSTMAAGLIGLLGVALLTWGIGRKLKQTDRLAPDSN